MNEVEAWPAAGRPDQGAAETRWRARFSCSPMIGSPPLRRMDKTARCGSRTVAEARRRIEAAGEDWRSGAIESRYGRVAEICARVVQASFTYQETLSDKLDRVLTHKLWGMLIFVLVMAVMFQSIFTFARIPMDAIQSGVDALGDWVGGLIPPGELNSLLVKGVIAGVGAVIVFLPQILLLFLFIGLLEDTGYMARAAFLMDRLMSKVGLHGKSFIPDAQFLRLRHSGDHGHAHD